MPRKKQTPPPGSSDGQGTDIEEISNPTLGQPAIFENTFRTQRDGIRKNITKDQQKSLATLRNRIKVHYEVEAQKRVDLFRRSFEAVRKASDKKLAIEQAIEKKMAEFAQDAATMAALMHAVHGGRQEATGTTITANMLSKIPDNRA